MKAHIAPPPSPISNDCEPAAFLQQVENEDIQG
jgi:hypothetical protein